MCHHERRCKDVPPTAVHDGFTGQQNKACLGQIVYPNQMGHFIIPQQLAVNVVLGSLESTHLISP